VIRTRVGYTGGDKANPTYYSLGNHTESLQVDFDPSRLSYQQLLDIFWASHDPSAQPYSTQYKAAVFYANAEQERLARASALAVEQRSGQPMYSEILPLKTFYRAEDYHQKYYLRHTPQLMAEAARYFSSDERSFTDSTLAARLNGYSGRFGSAAMLRAELPSYGLSNDGQDYLSRIAPALHDTPAVAASCGLPAD
jgi:peptide-methionine (S)-S-oxide reductase